MNIKQLKRKLIRKIPLTKAGWIALILMTVLGVMILVMLII
jgi:hypothetical protein